MKHVITFLVLVAVNTFIDIVFGREIQWVQNLILAIYIPLVINTINRIIKFKSS